MITNTGKQIVAKYLIGQTPSFASHIAVGCGAKPLTNINIGISSVEYADGFLSIQTATKHMLSSGQKVNLVGLTWTDTTKNLDGLYTILLVPDSEDENIFVVLAPEGLTAGQKDQSSLIARVVINFQNQDSLDFEMFRVPISSRGYVVENDVSKIVFTAELPTEERYEMTEIGLFSAGANPSAGIYDSRSLYSFTQSENWEYHSLSASTAIPVKNEPLDKDGTSDVINIVESVFQTTSDNRLFASSPLRISRGERGRFLNNTIMIAGDTSKIDVGAEPTQRLSVDTDNYESTHIHLDGISTDFNKQSPLDELRFAFSLVNKVGDGPSPSKILMILEFSSDDQYNSGKYARFEVNIEHDPELNATNNLNTNRYFVVKKELQELVKSTDFSWDAVNILKIYTCVLVQDNTDPLLYNPSPNYYIALDGLRLENKSSTNPLYGLTGYSVIANQDSSPIIKEQNTTNYVEFRTSVGIA